MPMGTTTRAHATWLLGGGATLLVTGCAWVLGGLEEGTERASDPTPATDAAVSPAPVCPGALAGFPYRRAITIDRADAAVSDYTVPIVLPTEALLAQGKLRPSGADYRFTDEQGRSLPFWLEGGADGGARRALVRVDLRTQVRAWVHYGNTNATSESQLLDAFMPGIIDDPTFARRDGWVVQFNGDPADGEPASWSTSYEDEGIRLKVSRRSGNNGTGPVACQTVTFPQGSRYRLVFDVAFVREGNSTVTVSVSGLGRGSVWGHSVVEGLPSLRASGEETIPFAAGTRVVCLGATVATAGGADAHFSRVRVRRILDEEATATVSAEERVCP